MEYTYKLKSDEDYTRLYVNFDHLKFQLDRRIKDIGSTLYIIRDKDEKEKINVSDYFMDFILLLHKFNGTLLSPNNIGTIEFRNLTIRNEELKTILYLCELANDKYFRNKYYSFYNCTFPKGTKLSILPCEDHFVSIHNAQFDDFLSLNHLKANILTINHASFKRYTGNVTINCKKLELNHTNMNIPLFCIKTQAPYLEDLEIIKNKNYSEDDLIFLHAFSKIKNLRIFATIQDTTCLDKMRNLIVCIGPTIKQDDGKHYLMYDSYLQQRLSNSRVATICKPLEDEEYQYWHNRIENANLQTIKEDLKDPFKQESYMKEALKVKINEGYPDLNFLLQSGFIREASTRRIDLDPIDGDFIEIEGIPYYETSGILINGKNHKSSSLTSEERLRKNGLRLSEEYLLSMHTIIPLLEYENGKITSTIIDTAGKFTIRGSFSNENIAEIKRQITNAKINSNIWERRSEARVLERIIK